MPEGPLGERPKGRFGLPRLTDIAPQVSYHNTPPSNCDREFCFDGHSKREVFVSIRDAYANNKQRLIDTLKQLGVNVTDIIISGSVVKGNFGCRDMNKIEEELDELTQDVWNSVGQIPDEMIGITNEALIESETPLELYSNIQSEAQSLKTDTSYAMEDIIISICSDIDMFLVFPESGTISSHKWHERHVQMEVDPIFHDMNETVKGKMRFIASESNEQLQENMDAPSISSVEGFDAIINKYY